jgi:excisionase family DNA binding protein
MLSKNPSETFGPIQFKGGLKIKDACIYLGGVSEITVRRLIARGLIKPNRSIRHILIPVAELDRFLAEG